MLEGFLLSGHAAGLQVGVHAIGDRAIEQVVSAWERVYLTLDSRARRHFRARRHRIEHVEMASASLIERAAMLGLGGRPSSRPSTRPGVTAAACTRWAWAVSERPP